MRVVECQQSSSGSPPFYASGPNDVWSLGIILVNLTCGRNPWKRASIDDSTFRAYLKNPRFLSSILPLSPELDSILRRIFECDPRKRISIPELRNLIIRCPRFTTRSTGMPPSPPPEPVCGQDVLFANTRGAAMHQYATPPYTPPASPPCQSAVVPDPAFSISPNRSSSSDEGSVFSDASDELTIEEDAPEAHTAQYVPSQPMNFYGNFIPLDPFPKPMAHQENFSTVAVC